MLALLDALLTIFVVSIIAFVITRIVKSSRKVEDADHDRDELIRLRRVVKDVERLAHNNMAFEPILADAILQSVTAHNREIK